MSLNNLQKKNNYTLKCRRLEADYLDYDHIDVETINIHNAIVTGQVTTPHITSSTSLFNTIDTLTINAQTANLGTVNSQTVNSLNIATDNISASTGTIGDLTIGNSLNTPSITTNNLTSNNGNISTLTSNDANIVNLTANSANINTSLTVPTINSNNITSTHGNISNLTTSGLSAVSINASGSIISPNANLDNISGTNLTYTNGTIDQLNGSNVQYGTGNISDISGSNLTYDTGYIPSLSTKELTIYTGITSCPNANIDNLTVNNTFTAPLFEAPEMHVDYVRSYSVGKTTFQENVVVDTQFNCPVVGADTIITNGSGTVAFGNNVTGSNINLSGTMTVPNTKTNIIDTVTGTGFINFQRPLVLPNTTISNALAYYSYNTLTLNATGCITTTLTGFGVRVGNMITVYIQCFPQTTLATTGSVLFITGIPSQYAPNVGPTRGTCLVNGVGTSAVGSYVFNVSGQLNIFSSAGGGGFGLGLPCGLYGAATDYASFSLITNI